MIFLKDEIKKVVEETRRTNEQNISSLKSTINGHGLKSFTLTLENEKKNNFT